MTKQEINEQIAKLCGWTSKEQTIERVTAGYDWVEKNTIYIHPERGVHFKLPQYTDSLDACREFEDAYTYGEQETVFDILCDEYGMHKACFATPLQRCEAFLRMKGQWE